VKTLEDIIGSCSDVTCTLFMTSPRVNVLPSDQCNVVPEAVPIVGRRARLARMAWFARLLEITIFRLSMD
jgi:hypothetical protein